MDMTRRRFLASSSAAAALGWLRPWSAAAQTASAQPAPPEPIFAAVRGGVGTFTMQGGTIGWLIVPDGVVVVDSQYPDSAAVCLDGLKARASRPMDVLVNTHHHADHTGGNQAFRPAVKHIVAHVKVPELQKAAAIAAKSEATQEYPDETFAEHWKLGFGAETVSARHYGPAHTGGDIIVTFEQANVVHMGDLVFNRAHPRVDRPAGASIANWITSLEKVGGDHARDTVYIFGHGNPKFGITGAREDLNRMRDYLTAVLDYTRKGMAAGQSRDELAKVETLAGFDEFAPLVPSLSLGAAVGVAYDELTGR